MKRRAIFSFCLAGVLLLVAPPANAATNQAQQAAMWLYTEFRNATGRMKNTACAIVPEALKPHVNRFVAGAASVTLVGQGVSMVPGATTIIKSSEQSARGDIVGHVMSKPVDKLIYAAGGIAAHALLIQLLVRPPREPAFGEKQRGNRGFFNTHVGWNLLVLFISLPSCVVDVGLIIALLARLPWETYAPALVVGKLLQPYVTAALLCSPVLVRSLPSQWKVVGGGEEHPSLEVAMWAALAAGIGFLGCKVVATRLKRSADDDVDEVME